MNTTGKIVFLVIQLLALPFSILSLVIAWKSWKRGKAEIALAEAELKKKLEASGHSYSDLDKIIRFPGRKI